MSKTRLELHEKLVEILGSRNVYFQPSESSKLSYPCIIYELSNYEDIFADNIRYNTRKRYEVIAISKDPEFPAVEEIRKLQYCSFDRSYVSDNLNHFVFTLFY